MPCIPAVLWVPHIAAGDNLNMPVVGRFLRGGGALMRRSFREDPLYAAVFSEYVYQMARRGHCLEFFPEGGRSRTGRLMPAKFGLLKMCVDSQRRGCQNHWPSYQSILAMKSFWKAAVIFQN
ncbi:MAG: hypothetical protein CM15mP120_22100 [Pseudomonadota bacterium]|nr:MAG: hypothetical protein CM15mP120_22100 [Pseudomonadota bacterium]